MAAASPSREDLDIQTAIRESLKHKPRTQEEIMRAEDLELQDILKKIQLMEQSVRTPAMRQEEIKQQDDVVARNKFMLFEVRATGQCLYECLLLGKQYLRDHKLPIPWSIFLTQENKDYVLQNQQQLKQIYNTLSPTVALTDSALYEYPHNRILQETVRRALNQQLFNLFQDYYNQIIRPNLDTIIAFKTRLYLELKPETLYQKMDLQHEFIALYLNVFLQNEIMLDPNVGGEVIRNIRNRNTVEVKKYITKYTELMMKPLEFGSKVEMVLFSIVEDINVKVFNIRDRRIADEINIQRYRNNCFEASGKAILNIINHTNCNNEIKVDLSSLMLENNFNPNGKNGTINILFFAFSNHFMLLIEKQQVIAQQNRPVVPFQSAEQLRFQQETEQKRQDYLRAEQKRQEDLRVEQQRQQRYRAEQQRLQQVEQERLRLQRLREEELRNEQLTRDLLRKEQEKQRQQQAEQEQLTLDLLRREQSSRPENNQEQRLREIERVRREADQKRQEQIRLDEQKQREADQKRQEQIRLQQQKSNSILLDQDYDLTNQYLISIGLPPLAKPKQGGGEIMSYKKYLKYKNKYLKLKNKQ